MLPAKAIVSVLKTLGYYGKTQVSYAHRFIFSSKNKGFYVFSKKITAFFVLYRVKETLF